MNLNMYKIKLIWNNPKWNSTSKYLGDDYMHAYLLTCNHIENKNIKTRGKECSTMGNIFRGYNGKMNTYEKGR